MFLIGLIVITPLIGLLIAVCYIAYGSLRILSVFGIIPIIIICVPAGYALIKLIAALWILFD